MGSRIAINIGGIIAKPTTHVEEELGVVDSAYASYLEILNGVPPDSQKAFGQYPTQPRVARFMADLISEPDKSNLVILDPGAGTGILASALCESLISRSSRLRRIHLVAYEVAVELLSALETTLASLREHAASRKVLLTFEIVSMDFVLDVEDRFGTAPTFDLVIMNPPYFKLAGDSPQARKLSHICHGQPNIYMMFMYLGARMMKEGGELVSITPRSFTAGEYFREFRRHFFAQLEPTHVHLFEARDDAFQEVKVLQENIICKFRSGKVVSTLLTVSEGVADLNAPSTHLLRTSLLLDRTSHSMALKLPSSPSQIKAIQQLVTFDNTLRSLGLRVSTGKVVAFRSLKWLRTKPDPSTAPMLWMQNVQRDVVNWPLAGISKQQYICAETESYPLLLKQGNYVVVRRFSSKDDKHRLIAAPLSGKEFPGVWIGLENHLNFIWSPDATLTITQVKALSSYLNSDVVEEYIRAISGNTQVGAAELMNLPVPPDVALRFTSNEVSNES